jgi:hypothetical protein
MTRTFIEVPTFTKRWKELGFSDEELRRFQIELLKNPEMGDIMQGTGGVRKARLASETRGKSGNARICYVDFSAFGKIYLITVYTKKEKENLTDKEKNIIRKLVKILKTEAGGGSI